MIIAIIFYKLVNKNKKQKQNTTYNNQTTNYDCRLKDKQQKQTNSLTLTAERQQILLGNYILKWTQIQIQM